MQLRLRESAHLYITLLSVCRLIFGGVASCGVSLELRFTFPPKWEEGNLFKVIKLIDL